MPAGDHGTGGGQELRSPARESAALIERYQRVVRSLALVGALVAGSLASLAIIGWAVGELSLARVATGTVTMKMNTALGLLALALALGSLLGPQGPSRDRLRITAAGVAAGIGVLTLVEYVFGIDLGIDELVVADPDVVGTVDPGRPAPNTALALALLGGALLLVGRGERTARWSQIVAGVATVLAVLTVSGYLTGTTEYRTVSDLTQMALPTALAVLGISVALMVFDSRRGIGRLLVAGGAGGRVARVAIPSVVVIPPLLAGLIVAVGDGGAYGSEVAVLIITVLFNLLMVVGAVLLSRTVVRSEVAIEEAVQSARSAAVELESANQQLAISNDKLQQYARVASHDLREPLLVIAGFAGILERRIADRIGPEEERFLENIQVGIGRMERMIEGLYAHSQVAEGPLDKAAVGLPGVVDEVLEGLGESIAASQASITVGELPDQVRAERTGLVAILQNLVSNAIKYSGERAPEIEIGAEDDGSAWRLWVADTGVGIAPNQREAIFEMFRRAHSSEVAGSGIGLATALAIVERHGGRIWVDAGRDGGSVFSFTLPKEPATPERSLPRVQPAGPLPRAAQD